MTRYFIYVDIKRCIGCHSCELACKQENGIPVGPKRIEVIEKGPYKKGGRLAIDYIPVMCKHCGDPPCAKICPTNAITKREDGIVLIDPELCIGCKACIERCPFAAISFNHERNIAEKCTLCAHRVEKGLLPACVMHCPADALHFGDVHKVTSYIKTQKALI
ncbi:MAG: 4Fe-4S dicluster domain-containing protein [Candidatus Bathyarchaeia archaeon]